MLKIDRGLFYLAGVVAGDGHLRDGIKWKGKDNSKDYGIMIYSNDIIYLNYLLNLIKNKIDTKTEIKEGKRAYYISIRNKKLHQILHNYFEIPLGKKSDILSISENLKEHKYFTYFLAGLFDTDGGLRGNSIGFCSASEKLVLDFNEYLNNRSITNSIDKWTNKKYNKEYYGLKISKYKIKEFLETIPLKNKNKLDKIIKLRECRSGQTG